MKQSLSTVPPASREGPILRDHVYDRIRTALMLGHFMAGQKLVIRQLASEYETSLTPVRESLRRLVAEGVLEGEPNRSVRVPPMTGAKIRELRDIRIAVEGLAVARAAERITPEEVAELRRRADAVVVARDQGDLEADVTKLGEFQLGVYRASAMPHLIRIIESLWLQTGPYLKLLYPKYIDTVMERRGDWRGRILDALEAHDAATARHEIEIDLDDALGYLITLVDAAEAIRS
ncbi:MAG: GntR family transcriptional regulator [Pseudomonadota bacterium]